MVCSPAPPVNRSVYVELALERALLTAVPTKAVVATFKLLSPVDGVEEQVALFKTTFNKDNPVASFPDVNTCWISGANPATALSQ